jgi:hypothetical protein
MGLVWFLFGAVCWTLWFNHNNFVFNNKITSSPRALIFRLISLMQHWMVASTGWHWSECWKKSVIGA